MIEKISAVTLETADMGRAVRFYESLGFALIGGSAAASFSSFRVGDGYLNLELQRAYVAGTPWGRVIFYVRDVDALYQRVLDLGMRPETQPRDAEWRERYFHLRDPDGHELSFARPLST